MVSRFVEITFFSSFTFHLYFKRKSWEIKHENENLGTFPMKEGLGQSRVRGDHLFLEYRDRTFGV